MRNLSDMRRNPGWPVATAIGGFATIIVFVRLGGPAGTLASLGEVILIALALALASRRRIDRTRALAIGLIVLCVLGLGAPVVRSLSTQHESRTSPTAVAHRHSAPTA
jgi:hypothetical protein